MLHIYVISLKKDIEKRNFISKTLENFGLEFSFIDAIYGKELSDDLLSSIKVKSAGKIFNRGFLPSSGEVGCALSHLKAYQNILDNNLGWACILEDDAILDERFKTFVTTFQDSKLDTKTLYLLGGQNGYDKGTVKSIKNTMSIGGQKFSKTIKSEEFIYRACCYLMNPDLAKELIQLSKNNFILADDWNYLVKNSIIDKIYLANFVDHPLDLSESHLEKERRSGKLNQEPSYLNNTHKLIMRIKGGIEWRLRVMSLKAYRYVERKI